MNSEERQIVIDLRVALWPFVRTCTGCRGTGQHRSGRRCRLCGPGRQALERSEVILRGQHRESA